MAHKIIWTDEAISDLEAIAKFIDLDSPFYAAFTVRRIVSRIEKLSNFPYSGRIVPEYGLENIREVLWYDYRIVYKVKKNEIIILCVFHGRRLISVPLK